MGVSPELSGAVHDLNARLGSILMAVSAVAELELDAETRTSMLTTAAGETIRASAEVAAIVALTFCALDDSETAACDLAAALSTAANTVRLHGIEVDTTATVPAVVGANAKRMDAVLPPLLRIVAGASKCVEARLLLDDDRVRVQLARGNPGQDPEPLPPVVRTLIEQLDARSEASDGSAFSWPAVAP